MPRPAGRGATHLWGEQVHLADHVRPVVGRNGGQIAARARNVGHRIG